MGTLLARLPGRSKTEAIEYAIGSFLSSDAVGRLKSMAGTLEITDTSSVLRQADRAN